ASVGVQTAATVAAVGVHTAAAVALQLQVCYSDSYSRCAAAVYTPTVAAVRVQLLLLLQ
ncbi:hypothetical protein BHE74_00013704, partial [Ensete ventricosum]